MKTPNSAFGVFSLVLLGFLGFFDVFTRFGFGKKPCEPGDHAQNYYKDCHASSW